MKTPRNKEVVEDVISSVRRHFASISRKPGDPGYINICGMKRRYPPLILHNIMGDRNSRNTIPKSKEEKLALKEAKKEHKNLQKQSL